VCVMCSFMGVTTTDRVESVCVLEDSDLVSSASEGASLGVEEGEEEERGGEEEEGGEEVESEGVEEVESEACGAVSTTYEWRNYPTRN